MAGPMPLDHDPVTPKTWLPDPSHYPEQLTPLSASVWFEAIGLGLHAAMSELRGPFGGFHARTEQGWAYEGEWDPQWDHDPHTMEMAALEIGSTWEATLKPRSHEITALLAAQRPERPSPADAGGLWDRSWELILEQWKIHFLAVIPAQMSAELFSRRYLDAIDGSDQLAPYRILESVPNETNEADARIWELARRARQLGVDDVFVEFPPDLVPDRLALTHNGRLLRHELDEYLLRFGGRARWHELSLPREVEMPRMTVESIRLFIEAGRPPRVPDHAEAQRLEKQLLSVAPDVEDLLAAAKVGHALKESHAYHIDYPTLLVTRELLLGFGRRLVVSGNLDSVDDVWMLRREELRAAASGEETANLKTLVRERREELARGRSQGPAPYLGEAPMASERDPILEKFYGNGGAGASDLKGVAASPGVATGAARLVLGPDDFGRVRPGDILVATTTTPAWTPLFPSLAGIVTESGGVLCHGAIVAREYGIPAVVGLPGATERISDGMPVQIDGRTGEVTVMTEGTESH